jgi:transcriptional regulator with GAF, ATPase, and Fis domain
MAQMTSGEDQPEGHLAESLADAARALEAADSTQATLNTICRLAVDVIDGAEHAAITIVRKDRFVTIAATSDTPRVIDKIQYETSEGPCLDTIREHAMFMTDDLASEHRWPEFISRVVANTGVRSMLSHRLFLDGDTLGALNMYANPTGAFTKESQSVGAMFAVHAAVAYQAAKAHEKAENLEIALLTSRRIGIAVGILMAREGLTDDQAFDELTVASQRGQRKVAQIAEEVILTGELQR